MTPDLSQTLNGSLNATNMKIAIIASRFNQIVVDRLLAGAMEAIVQHGGKAEEQVVCWVPGAWEIPVVAKKAAQSRNFDAVVCLGALIKGGTYHFEYVAKEACKGIAEVGLRHDIPVTMGVLTTETMAQALERAGGTNGNAGYNAALAAIETVNLLKKFD